MASGLKDLKLWQEAVVFGGEVLRAVLQESRKEHKAFADVVMVESASIALLVAEGHGLYESSEQQRCYRAARAALAATETRLAVARHGGIISAPTLARLTGQIAIVGRLLAGYLTYLERQIAAEEQHAERGRVFDDRPVRAASGPAALAAANETLEQVDRPQP